MEDDIQTDLADRLKKISNMYSQEIKLIRTIIIACITVISICIVLYFNYILIGQFFTTIFLSLVASFALRPTKDSIICHFEENIENHKYYVKQSKITKSLQGIYNIIKIILQTIVFFRPIQIKFDKMQDEFVKNYLYFIVFIYVIIFKLDIYLTLLIVSIILAVDLIFRICVDILIIVIKRIKNTFLRFFIFQEKKSQLNDNVHSFVALILISLFLILIIMIVFLSLWLIYIDVKFVYSESKNDYSEILHRFIPKNMTDFSNQFSNFYQNNLFTHLKSFEEYVKEDNFTEFRNQTLYCNI
jgi:hypothetical protein